MQDGSDQGALHSWLGVSKGKVSWSWAWRVVEERGKQGLYAGVLLCLTSLSGLFRVLYGFFPCRSCLVLEQTCIYFQCKIL